MAEHHWLTVVGDSGSGKSSLVRAGLVPALKNGNCPTPGTLSRRWTIHVLTPTAHPLEALAIQLTRDAQSAMAAITLIDDLARDARTLRIYSGKSMHDANQILLVIDQFEELFTLCREERERQRFIDNLLLATAPELDRPISVVVALRADFYARFAAYTNLREALSRRQEYIGPMNADELRSVIQGPAERGGWELEPGLVELMLRDVGNEPGALPLLSHALLEIWKHRDGQRLTLAGYSECGGVHGAIAQTAERVYHRLSVEGQTIARRIFLKLTELGEGTEDTRRRVSLGELVPNPADAPRVQAVLQTLAEARLVTLGEDAVEVAHEALIREWPTLREWLNQNRDGLRLHRQLTEAAQAWEKMNRDAGELYRGVRLAQAMEWAKAQPAELHPLELEFLDAARAWQEREETEREAQRQRELAAAQRLADVQTHNARQLRQRAFFLAGASLVAVVLAIIAVAFGQQSNQNAMRAENERSLAFARELSANAVNNLNLDPERSILLALRAVSVSNAGGRPGLREAEEALHRAVQASRVRLVLRGHTVGLYDIAYSPDGKRLATAGGDKTVKLWEVATGKEVLTLRGHSNIVYRVAFSPDGTRLATASFDGTANIWDAESGKLLLTLRGHTNYVDGIAFTPDGTRLATASLDGTAKVWDALTGQELLTLNAHPEGLSSVAFSPDGKRLATGSWAGEVEHTAKVWDAITGNLLLTLRGHASTLYDIAFSPDGKRLTTASTDGTARIWDSASGQQLLILFVHSGVLQVTFSPDPAGTRLATADGDGTAKVWDAMTGELLANVAGHTATVSGVSFSPDGMRIATASHDATARVWDISPASSGEGLMIVGNGDSLLDLAYSPDGRRIATAGRDKTARIWDSGTGKELDTLTGHSGMVRSVAFSPDGTRLATTGVDQTLKVWDMATGNPLLNLSTSSFVSLQGPQVVFSPDGQWMASGAAGGTTQVWDAATGKGLLTLCCHSSSFVRGVAFSPDGTLLATGGFDNLVKVWDLATGKEMLTLAGHTAGIWAVAFSPDSRLIATVSTDGTAKLWELATGKELVTFSGHSGTVNDIAFSPDGIHIATASSDGTVKVWDVPTASARGEQPLTLYNPGSAMFHGVAFSPDGKRLAASGADGNVRIYALALEDIIAIAKSRLTRNWTLDECLKFLHMETCPPE